MSAKLTNEDVERIQDGVQKKLEPRFYNFETDIKEIKEEVHEGMGTLRSKIDSLTSSVDEFLHFSRRHEDELVVLRAQTGRIRDVLVDKGVATEDELSIL